MTEAVAVGATAVGEGASGAALSPPPEQAARRIAIARATARVCVLIGCC